MPIGGDVAESSACETAWPRHQRVPQHPCRGRGATSQPTQATAGGAALPPSPRPPGPTPARPVRTEQEARCALRGPTAAPTGKAQLACCGRVVYPGGGDLRPARGRSLAQLPTGHWGARGRAGRSRAPPGAWRRPRPRAPAALTRRTPPASCSQVAL